MKEEVQDKQKRMENHIIKNVTDGFVRLATKAKKLIGKILKPEIRLSRKTVSSVFAITMLAAVTLPTSVFAQGLTIPSGSQINVNTGTLDVAGTLTIAGTLQTSTGGVEITRGWSLTTGFYDANMGTVDFTGTLTQMLDTTGTLAGQRFYNFAHSGSGRLEIINNPVNVENDVRITGGIVDANALDMTVAGDWRNTGSFVAGSATVTLDGTGTQTFFGNTTFNNLTKSVTTAGTLLFDVTGTQSVSGTLTLTGTMGQLLTINSTDDDGTPTRGGLALLPGGNQVLSFLDVRLNDASGGLTLNAGATSTDSGLNINWVFGGATLTWDGDDSTDWNDPDNWDLGFVPGSSDLVVIPAAPSNQPSLTSNVTVAAVTIAANGGELSIDGFDFTITGTLSNEGTIVLHGDETVSIAMPDTDSGAFEFVGNGDGSVDVIALPNFGADFFSIEINDTNPTMDTFTTTGTVNFNGNVIATSGTLDSSSNTSSLVISGTLQVAGGSVLATNGSLNIDGNLIITSGTLNAPDTGGTFLLAGNFIHTTSGTFIANGGTVIFDGTSQSIIGDVDNWFAGFIKQVTAADTFTFSTSSEQHVTGTLTITGTVGNILSIQSDTGGVRSFLTLAMGGVQDIQYVDVRDNNAGNGLTLIARNSTETFNNNVNWDFDGATITWQGDVDDNWDNPMNWDLGIVPSTGDTAVIPDVAGPDPIMQSAVSIAALTINDSVVVQSDSFNLVISGTFSNEGTLQLDCNETFSVGMIDSDSGEIQYIGNGDNTVDTCIIAELGTTDYFSLSINDTSGTMDIFQTNGTLTTAGTLIITSGTMDISTNTNLLETTGTIYIVGGTLSASGGRIDANSGVNIQSGSLVAPTGTFTVAGDWVMETTGTLINSSSTVTFDDSAQRSNILGDTTFFHFSSRTSNKQLYFESGQTTTVEGSISLIGTPSNLIVVRSTISGTPATLSIPGGSQIVSFVNVADNTATPNFVSCINCTDADPGSTTNWLFNTLLISIPQDGVVTDTTPTIIGEGSAGFTVDIRNSANAIIGSTVIDDNGNFRLEVSGTLALTPGAETLTPYIGAVSGSAVSITVVAAPTTTQVPVIDSHMDDDRVQGTFPTFTGSASPNDIIEVVANDENGNLLLTTIGTGTVDATGSFSITGTIALTKGRNFISVTVNGVASDILEVRLTDPFGTIFDSINNQPLEGASITIVFNDTGLPGVPGVELASDDVNPTITGTLGEYSFDTINGDYHFVVSKTDYIFPSIASSYDSGRSITIGSKGETFTVAGTVLNIDVPMDPNPQLLRIEKDANKKEVRIGEVVTYTIDIENVGSITAEDVGIEDKIPAGFKYIEDRVIYDGQPLAAPSGNRPVVFSVGDIGPGEKHVLKYQLVVGTGVSFGDYINIAFAMNNPTSLRYSNDATETVTVVPDPLFDLGTTLGKVFYDRNENGVQDPPVYDPDIGDVISEDPVPNVRIVMEDGTVVVTDKDGRYSVPALTPGRHLFRVDERTLPQGTYLTTEKVVVVDITQGILKKVNFGINVDDGLILSQDAKFYQQKVKVIQEQDKPKPRLHVATFDQAATFEDKLLEPVEFRIFTNYAAFIDKWILEIVDKDTKEVVRTIDGTALNIYDPLFFDGKKPNGEYIKPDGNYGYRLVAEDKTGKFDETKLQDLPVTQLYTESDVKDYRQQTEERAVDKIKWIAQESRKNSLQLQNILVDGETVVINRLDTKLAGVRVKKDGQLVTEVPLVERHALTAKELLAGAKVESVETDRLDVILPVGEFELVIQEDVGAPLSDTVSYVEGADVDAIDLADVERPTVAYSKPIKVGEDQLFFVAMGDAKLGYNFTSGNIEPIDNSDNFKDGFYAQGKAAYYMKGKILGKYLITSSFDTERERKEIFRNLDPDEYYPVYGDGSKIDYEATDTQGNLYVLIEWDKSFVKWGNYNVEFADTEFARYNRSLYGGKVSYESLSTTEYGDPRTKVIAFNAKAQQKSAHIELLATGGSLYYTKHKDVIEGSDKLKIEVRDKITGLVISEREMVEGADYEMDYNDGRILFWQPVPILVQSYSIISSDLLDGNLVYVVADYEYEVKDKIDERSIGVRAQQAISEGVSVGGTYVKEVQEEEDYQLRGTDITFKVGEDTRIVAEYAESEEVSERTFLSTDGGITYTEQATAADAFGKAFGIKGDTRLFNKLAISAFYKWVENDFSTSATTAQQGKELAAIEAIYDISDRTRLSFRHDYQQLLDDGSLQSSLQLGTGKKQSTIVQFATIRDRARFTAEYQRISDDDADTTEDIVAARVDYKVSDKLEVSLEQQLTVKGDTDSSDTEYQTTIAAIARPTERIALRAKEVFTEDGMTTQLGATVDVSERLALTGDYIIDRDQDGLVDTSAQVGAIAKINDRVRLRSSIGISEDNITRDLDVDIGAEQELFGGTKIGGDFGIDETGATTSKVSFGGTTQVTEDTALDSEVTVTQQGQTRQTKLALGGTSKLGEQTDLESKVTVTQQGESRATDLVVGTTSQLTEDTAVDTKVTISQAGETQSTTVAFGGKSQLDEDTEVETRVAVTDAGQVQTTSFTIGGKQQVDEKTRAENLITFTESTAGYEKTEFTFGTTKKISDFITLETNRTFGAGVEDRTLDQSYSLSRVKDGKTLKGTLSRKFTEGTTEASRSNIFGLTGEIDDRWALTGAYERAEVKNLDGSDTRRDALSIATGYVKKDEETGKEVLKSSTKLEVRFDEGTQDKRQYLFSSVTEGELSPGLSLFAKIEFSETRDTTLGRVEAQHKEFVVGGAYRPIMMDRLNVLGRYTYLEGQSPASQEDTADIEEEAAHVVSTEFNYEINERWLWTEKFAFRLAQEKVAGFDFTDTHTWLMIHRLDYRINRDWAIGGEYRMLTQREAQDRKKGALIEITRRVGEYAQLGVGYDFTDFDDDLTDLDYTTQGPFIRMTGKFYDRTPEEIERERQRWLDEKIARWAVIIVEEELSLDDSPVLRELNDYFVMAQMAYEKGDYQESERIYKDIIVASEMMLNEAKQYIRKRIDREERLEEMKGLADQYYKNGQYDKAKKILEKILEEAEKGMVE